MQGGIHAAHTIRRRLTEPGTANRPFRYRNLGDMATISRFQAVASLGPVKIGGFIGWLMWLFVHLAFLTGFKNRVATVFNWFIAFVGRGRPQRAISMGAVSKGGGSKGGGNEIGTARHVAKASAAADRAHS